MSEIFDFDFLNLSLFSYTEFMIELCISWMCPCYLFHNHVYIYILTVMNWVDSKLFLEYETVHYLPFCSESDIR